MPVVTLGSAPSPPPPAHGSGGKAGKKYNTYALTSRLEMLRRLRTEVVERNKGGR